MSTQPTPQAVLSDLQTMLREAVNRLVPPIVDQMLAAKVGTLIRGGRIQAGGLVGTIPGTVVTASLADATTGAIGGVEIDQAPASGHPVAVTTPRIGAVNGVAGLDAGGKVPVGQLPALGMADPMTTRGDLIARLAGGTGRLALGTNGQVLTSNGTDALWATFAALTNPMTTLDDVIVGGAAGAPARLAKGTAGQVLTVDAASGHVAWDTPVGATGGTTVVQLNYQASTDLASGTALAATTWTDVGANQTFTVDGATNIIEIAVGGVITIGNSNVGAIASRLLLDSAGAATTYPLGGGNIAATLAFVNALAGAGPVVLTGLAAGSHTVKVQVYAAAAQNIYCRASTQAATEFLGIRVLERKQ